MKVKVNELLNVTSIKPLKLPLREVSHITIEPNYTCNLGCTECYNQEKHYVKSLAQIKSEIDLACLKRNIETISIVGGEPNKILYDAVYGHLGEL